MVDHALVQGGILEKDDVGSAEVPFEIHFMEDGSPAVAFSEAFLAKSLSGQLEAVERFYAKKMAEPIDSANVGVDAAKNEVVMLFVELVLTRLKRGERIDSASEISLSLKELMVPEI